MRARDLRDRVDLRYLMSLPLPGSRLVRRLTADISGVPTMSVPFFANRTVPLLIPPRLPVTTRTKSATVPVGAAALARKG